MYYLTKRAKELIPEVKEKLIRTRDRLKCGDESWEELLVTKKNCFSFEKCIIPGGVASAAQDVLQSKIGLAIQDMLQEESRQKVINFDSRKKEKGADILVEHVKKHSPIESYLQGKKNIVASLKFRSTTQTGSHSKDAIKHLVCKSAEFNAMPCIAYAMGKPKTEMRDGVLYLVGKDFWKWHGIDDFEVQYMNAMKEFINLLGCDDFKGLFSEILFLAKGKMNIKSRVIVNKVPKAEAEVDFMRLIGA
jgi:hypothetical protein